MAVRQHISSGAPRLPVPARLNPVHGAGRGGGRTRQPQPAVRLAGAAPDCDGRGLLLLLFLLVVVFFVFFFLDLQWEADPGPGGRRVCGRQSGGEDAALLRNLLGVQEAVGVLRGE